MINKITTFNFSIILLSYALLNSTNILLGMEIKPESPTLYIQYTEPLDTYSIISEVKLTFDSSIDFTKFSAELYPQIHTISETKSTSSSISNHQPFLLKLYHYNECMMPYKSMYLTPTQTIEIINQQKNNHSIFIHGTEFPVINGKKQLFKINFSPPITTQSSLYQKQIKTIEKELLNDQATMQFLEKTTKYEKTLLDRIILLEQKLKKMKNLTASCEVPSLKNEASLEELKKLELMNLNNMIDNDEKMLKKDEKLLAKLQQIITLEKEVAELKQTLQKKDTLIQNKESIEQTENILKNQAINRATIFFLMSKITLMITYALAHNTLLPLLFFINIMTNLLYYSTQN